MNRAELDEFLAERGFQVDDGHFPHGNSKNKFCDLYVGIGRSREELAALQAELGDAEMVGMTIDRVTNPEHEDYGKQMLVINSFWNE